MTAIFSHKKAQESQIMTNGNAIDAFVFFAPFCGITPGE
jgi:hypothetical protein